MLHWCSSSNIQMRLLICTDSKKGKCGEPSWVRKHGKDNCSKKVYRTAGIWVRPLSQNKYFLLRTL